MTKPVLVRPDGSIGPAGLRLIEEMAAASRSQRSIAVALGVSFKKFERSLEKNKGENDVRVAWEAGFAVADEKYGDMIRARAFGGVQQLETCSEEGTPLLNEDGTPQTVYVNMPNLKDAATYAIWLGKNKFGWADKPQQTGLDTDGRIQITLPDALSFAEFMKAAGQTEAIDARRDKTVPIKDITPDWAKLDGPRKEEE